MTDIQNVPSVEKTCDNCCYKVVGAMIDPCFTCILNMENLGVSFPLWISEDITLAEANEIRNNEMKELHEKMKADPAYDKMIKKIAKLWNNGAVNGK